MAEKWNYVDLVLSQMRINKIRKYIHNDSTIVDVGCGYHFKLLKTLEPFFKIGYGFDMQVSTNNYNNKIFLHDLDITTDKYPIKDNIIDVVISLAVIEHLYNPDHMLNESKRILKKGGLLLMTTPTPPSKPILEFCCYTNIFKNKDALDHKIYYSKKMLIHALKKAGFKIVKHKYFQFGLNQYVVAQKIESHTIKMTI